MNKISMNFLHFFVRCKSPTGKGKRVFVQYWKLRRMRPIRCRCTPVQCTKTPVTPLNCIAYTGRVVVASASVGLLKSDSSKAESVVLGKVSWTVKLYTYWISLSHAKNTCFSVLSAVVCVSRAEIVYVVKMSHVIERVCVCAHICVDTFWNMKTTNGFVCDRAKRVCICVTSNNMA